MDMDIDLDSVDGPDQITEKISTPRKAGSRKSVAPNLFRLGYLIHDVSRMRRTIFDQYMKPEGITRSQWWVLANLSRQEGGAIIGTDLAKLLDISKVTLSGLIDRLEIAGHIYRRGDRKDKRFKRIHISQAGYALIDRMRGITEKLNRRFTIGMTAEQVEQTELNLILMKDNLREMLAESGDDVESDI